MAEILLVCTGNVCRSPLAEQLLAHRLAAVGLTVSSAGTRGLRSAPMTAEAARLAIEFGVPVGEPARHRSRRLDEEMVDRADLVLTMTRDQRHEVAELVPARIRSTFTVREFARIAGFVPRESLISAAREAGSDPALRLRAVGRLLATDRGLVPGPVTPEDDDVIDPYGRSWETYRRSADQLRPALEVVAAVVQWASAGVADGSAAPAVADHVGPLD